MFLNMQFRHVLPYSRWTRINEEGAQLTGVPVKEGEPVKPEEPQGSASGIATPDEALLKEELITIAVDKTQIPFTDLVNATGINIPYDLYAAKTEWFKPISAAISDPTKKVELVNLVKSNKMIICPPTRTKKEMGYFKWVPADTTGDKWMLEPYAQPGFGKIAWTFKNIYAVPVPTTNDERKADPTLKESFLQLGIGNADSTVKSSPFATGEWIHIQQVAASTASVDYNKQYQISARTVAPQPKTAGAEGQSAPTPSVFPPDLVILESKDIKHQGEKIDSYGYAVIIKRNEAQTGGMGISRAGSGSGGYGTPVEKYSAKYF
jgi:hypothetical protein